IGRLLVECCHGPLGGGKEPVEGLFRLSHVVLGEVAHSEHAEFRHPARLIAALLGQVAHSFRQVRTSDHENLLSWLVAVVRFYALPDRKDPADRELIEIPGRSGSAPDFWTCFRLIENPVPGFRNFRSCPDFFCVSARRRRGRAMRAYLSFISKSVRRLPGARAGTRGNDIGKSTCHIHATI